MKEPQEWNDKVELVLDLPLHSWEEACLSCIKIDVNIMQKKMYNICISCIKLKWQWKLIILIKTFKINIAANFWTDIGNFNTLKIQMMEDLYHRTNMFHINIIMGNIKHVHKTLHPPRRLIHEVLFISSVFLVVSGILNWERLNTYVLKNVDFS